MGSQKQQLRWSSRLLYIVAGMLLFEIVTGLSITFLPFSIGNQVIVLLHTFVGLLFLFPYLYYQYRHWRFYKDRPLNEISLTGYTAMVCCLVAIVSGLFLTWQALYATTIGMAWKNIHLIATFVLIVSTIPHVLLIVWRDQNVQKETATIRNRVRGQKYFAFNSVYNLFLLLSVVGLIMFAYSSPKVKKELPSNYRFHANSDSPFYPSLASTGDSSLINPNMLGGSESCGQSGCHQKIKEEWEVSAHRYAAGDPFFRKIQENMGKQKGPIAARYCAGCHDPVGLFGGSANLFSDSLTYKIGIDEGISCISCHAITQADVQGNADYVIQIPDRYLFELNDDQLSKWISNFLIRAYPEYHKKSYNRPLLKTSEYCGACHKQYVDEDINNVGWVQLQNQYDQWRKSHWFTKNEPMETIECRECHMPLKESDDPASGDPLDYNRTHDDGMHRSHRFLGGNQFVPKLMDLPGAEKHVKMIEEWLQGDYPIPEIEDKWVSGAAAPITLVTSDTLHKGSQLQIDVLVNNKKAGHEFPTGPLDMIQAWIELTVKDQEGNLLYRSGGLDRNHFIQPGSFVYKAEPVDQYGNLIDRHNLWEMVGVRYSRALFPGKSDYARFSISPDEQNMKYNIANENSPATYQIDQLPDSATQIHITVKLQYRKFNQFLMNEVFKDIESFNTAPITTISEDSKTITVIPNMINSR